MEWTPFAGLTALDENDDITIDGASFLITNPRVTDRLLRIGAVDHRHDAHPAIPNPNQPMSGQAIASAGTLSAGADFVLTYTLVDQFGGETTPAQPLTLSTGLGVDDPTYSPETALINASGIMPAGTYFYAITLTDGQGGETLLSPLTAQVIDPGYSSASICVSNLDAGLVANGGTATDWRLWRSYEGADWHLVAQGSGTSFLDDGFDPPDNPAEPPDVNTTGATNTLAVTLPTVDQEPAMASAVAINIYLASDEAFAEPCFYEQIPGASAGTTLVISDDTVSAGHPPHVSTSIPGARQIYPDTDMRWALKSPVSTFTLLSSGSYGDVRIALDTQHLWAVLGSGGALDETEWTDLTGVFGIECNAPGYPIEGYYTVAEENFASGGSVGDFTSVGTATLDVLNGILTTTDARQVDAFLVDADSNGPHQICNTLSPDNLWAAGFPTYISDIPHWTGAHWHYPLLYFVTDTAAVAGFVGTPADGLDVNGLTGVNDPSTTPQNYKGDMICVQQSGPFDPSLAILLGSTPTAYDYGGYQSYARDLYVWDGSQWQLIWHWVGPAEATAAWFNANQGDPDNWEELIGKNLRRSEPDTGSAMYAYQWTAPGQFGSDYKFRVRLRLKPQSPVGGQPFSVINMPGIVMNMADQDDGLTWYPWGGPIGYSGWTKKPSDLLAWGTHFPPERVEPDGTYLFPDEHPFAGSPTGAASATMYIDTVTGNEWTQEFDDIHGNLSIPRGTDRIPVGFHANEGDFWIEVWRKGNKAYAAFYKHDPATGADPLYVSTFAEDLSGGVYDDAQQGYFGLVFPYLNSIQGVVDCQILTPGTVVPQVKVQRLQDLTLLGPNVEMAGGGTSATVRIDNAIAATEESDPAYTFASGDRGIVLEYPGATEATWTIPADSVVPFAVGSVIDVCQLSSGQVVIQPSGGVTLDGGSAGTAGQFQTLRLRKRGRNEWIVVSTGGTGGGGGTGPAGPQGPAGPAGPQGPAGSATAFTASAGNASAIVGPFLGFAGSGGVSAELIASGGSAIVLIGASGMVGPQGPQGPAGASGASGAQGPQGPQGPAGPAGSAANFVASAGTASAIVGPFLGFFGSAGVSVELVSSGGSAVIVLGASGIQGPQGAAGAPGAPGPQGPAGAGVGVGGAAASPLIDPASYVEFTGSGAVQVGVTDLGGGSARVSIGALSEIVAASAGASAVNPAPYIEFAASGNSGANVAVQNLGGGSARVLISAPSVVPKNIQSSGYILASSDVGLVVESPSAGAGSAAIGYLIAPQAQSGIGVDSVIEVFQYGTGQITVVPSAGVTLRSDGAKSKTAAQFATIGLRQRAVDEWVITGDAA